MPNHFPRPRGFDKKFTDLEPIRYPREASHNLRVAIREAAAGDPAASLSDIPVGLILLDRFIDHITTFDQTLRLPQIDGPEETEQTRTPTHDMYRRYGHSYVY
jgi:hypothetical protein